jgi:LysM repeat protein
MAIYLAADAALAGTSLGDRLVREDGSAIGEVMPGQMIRLVPAGFHVVRPGQTLWGISRLYRTTVAKLQEWNPAVVPTAMPVGTLLRVVSPQ